MNRGEELRLKVALRDTRTAGEKVLDACRGGKPSLLPGLLAGMTPVERRACLPELKELRRQVRADWSTGSRPVREALQAAGAGCHTSPVAAATWIGSGDLAGWTGLDTPAVVTVIGQQPADWQATVVARLAARRPAAWGWNDYPVIERLVRTSGCPVPTSDTFVEGWLRDRTWGARGNRRRGSLLDLLRADDLLPVLLPRLFEIADVGDLAVQPNRAPEDGWPGALAALARDGALDRADLIARCTARLLRGGKPADQRAFLAVLEALAPSPEEHAVHARSHLAMLAGLSSVAGHAQRVLADLDERGLVEPELLGEASEAVLFRTEKKLVRAQLGWLDRAARRDPARSGPVVLAAAGAFGQSDTALQERALNIVARHLPAAGPAVLPELREAAGALNPVHHARAAGLLGADLAAPEAAPADLLPPAPRPQPLGAPLATPAEVAEELSAVLAGGADVAAFERTLDGLVRHAHRDREALVEALQPVLRVHPWSGVGRWSDCGPQDVLFVAAAVAGLVPPHRLWDGLGVRGSRSPLRSHTGNTAFGRWFAVRLEEAAWQVTATRPPLLLAVPTEVSGALDAAELVARLTEYEAAGVAPGSADLSCALLRVAPTEDRAVLAAAGRLVSPAGRWAAAWLRDGGLADQPSERVRFAPGGGGEPVFRFLDRWWERLVRIEVAQPGPRVPVGPAGEQLVAECLELLAATGPGVQRARTQAEWNWVPTPHWLAALPHHREELAARLLDGFAGAADRDERGAPQLLPHLAEAGGPAGVAVHLALGYGLAARHEEDRTAAVDALLVLAARGDLDGGLLGTELAALAAVGAVKPSRLAPALAAAAGTGAYGTVWTVLAGALPGLLTGEPARGLGELLTLAADCARRAGARGAVAEVTAVAGRGGSSRLVREARALREVLGEG
ncbi:DUF6493 family protein [Kitasatospora sp. NPDC057015]|uniref:DUF7824 domain-containing protein n=1 Tax=Kitasatospora sp. NPDC057015 TaxID=3346001 RepID=UPI0036413ABA